VITIEPSPTADTRTCDFANTTKETLLASSRQHIRDVGAALNFFTQEIAKALHAHDVDKITDIDGFHRDFIHGFTEADYTEWWRKHRRINRHHLTQDDGVRDDVNLIDVLDFIADCVMAGMARSGSVYELKLSPELLERAFQNTVSLLKSNVQVRASDRSEACAHPGSYVMTRYDGRGCIVSVESRCTLCGKKLPVTITGESRPRTEPSW
jgi:hypothetical protein